MAIITTRTFSANEGDPSIGNAGPDVLEQDLDNLYNNSDELNAKDEDLQVQVNNLVAGGTIPLDHSSADTIYGLGSTTKYGHVKIVNNLTTSESADGQALGPSQGKILADRLTNVEAHNVVTFTASGSWTVPAGVKKVDVFLVGGGGGGGANMYDDACGSGGGTGGIFKFYPAITVTPGVSIPITIGAGGAGGVAGVVGNGNGFQGSGNNGGYSQFLNSNYRSGGGIGGYPSGVTGSSSGSGAGGATVLSGASMGTGGGNKSVGHDGGIEFGTISFNGTGAGGGGAGGGAGYYNGTGGYAGGVGSNGGGSGGKGATTSGQLDGKSGVNGTVGGGGGGAGANASVAGVVGGNGGSGVCIISY